jgi:hypothetical protein
LELSVEVYAVALSACGIIDELNLSQIFALFLESRKLWLRSHLRAWLQERSESENGRGGEDFSAAVQRDAESVKENLQGTQADVSDKTKSTGSTVEIKVKQGASEANNAGSVEFGLGALVAAGAVVVEVGVGGGFAAVDPVVVAVRAPRFASVGAAAAAARGKNAGEEEASDVIDEEGQPEGKGQALKDGTSNELNAASDMVKDARGKTKETTQNLKEVGVEAAKAVVKETVGTVKETVAAVGSEDREVIRIQKKESWGRVEEGDTLWDLSEKYLRDPTQWEVLQAAFSRELGTDLLLLLPGSHVTESCIARAQAQLQRG